MRRAILILFFLVPALVQCTGETALEFRSRMITTFCNRQKNVCCNGQPFDMAKCEAILFTGYEFSGMQLDVSGVDQDNVEVDSTHADACISKLSTLACDNTGIQGSAIRDASLECFAAFRGTVGASGACHADIECVGGHYCDAGSCVPLKTSGQACHATDPFVGNNCSTRGSGDTGLYCGPASTCSPLLGLGSTCVINAQCASGSCDPSVLPPVCRNTHTDTALCSYFVP